METCDDGGVGHPFLDSHHFQLLVIADCRCMLLPPKKNSSHHTKHKTLPCMLEAL